MLGEQHETQTWTGWWWNEISGKSKTNFYHDFLTKPKFLWWQAGFTRQRVAKTCVLHLKRLRSYGHRQKIGFEDLQEKTWKLSSHKELWLNTTTSLCVLACLPAHGHVLEMCSYTTDHQTHLKNSNTKLSCSISSTTGGERLEEGIQYPRLIWAFISFARIYPFISLEGAEDLECNKNKTSTFVILIAIRKCVF